jgi:hypothetical protein
MDKKIDKLIELCGTKNKYQFILLFISLTAWINNMMVSVTLPILEKTPEVVYKDLNGNLIKSKLDYEICKFPYIITKKYPYSWVSDFNISCDKLKTGFIGTINFLGSFVGSLTFNMVVDNFGRKNTIIFSLIIYIIINTIMVFFNDYYIILFLNFFLELCGCYPNYSLLLMTEEITHLDYRGNLLMPDISGNLLREKKSNDLPFGWIGIGLNVLGKYDNDDWLINNTDSSEWVTAYYGIVIDSIFEFRNLIQNIIMKKGLEESEESSSLTDSNLSDKKYIWEIGKDVCLTPSIKNAENDAKKISIDNKEYKIVFMEKVFKNGIKEADRTDYWILDNKNVRIYRILFKEITLNISYNKYLEEQLYT